MVNAEGVRREISQRVAEPIVRKIYDRIYYVQGSTIGAAALLTLVHPILGIIDKEGHAKLDNKFADPKIDYPFKEFGLLTVIKRKAKTDIDYPDLNFSLQKGDSYLELHLPIPDEDEQDIAARIKQSLSLLAQFINLNNLHPKYILGATYRSLAMASRRFGFQVVDIPIPIGFKKQEEEMQDSFKITRAYQRGEEMGKALLCFQKTEKFLQRFS